MDALLSFCCQLATVKMNWEYQHVQSHQDVTHSIQDLTPQQLNVMADALAKHALMTSHLNQHYSKPDYPGKSICIFSDGCRVTSSIKSALYSSRGSQVAKTFLDKRKIICTQYFHLVDWDNQDRTMNSLLKMFQVWVTKHIAGFYGTNKHLSCLYSSTTNHCHCCGTPEELPRHITQCPNPGRVNMFNETVTELIQWMTSRMGHHLLVNAIRTYLSNRGRIRMTRMCADSPTLHQPWSFFFLSYSTMPG